LPHSVTADDPDAVRINRYLAAAGIGSRRAVEDLVRTGRVVVNGEIERDLARRIGLGDAVAVDGRPVGREAPVHVLLHKPGGVVTTARDPQGRRTVLDLVDAGARLFPVGRLDRDTTGALILTNDGELAHRLMHPRHEVEKTYVATLRGEVPEDAVRRLAAGVDLDGRPTAPARVSVIERHPDRTVLEIVLREGRNRQVRRMAEVVGHPALALHRPRYGPVGLGRLRPGGWRALTARELADLRSAAGLARGP
jgi:pseudouridine synthase